MLHGDLLGERARLTPEKLALVFVPTGERWTYAALDARASRCATLLRDRLGLVPGERFAVLSGNRPEVLDLFFAAGKSGCVVVPLGTRLTPRELSAILTDCGASALFFSAAHVASVAALDADLPLAHRVALDAPAADALGYGDLLASCAPGAGGRARPAPEDLYALLYTSGTTGAPKGVMLPHRMVTWNGYNTALSWQLREDDVSPIFTPLYHAGGLGAFLVPLFAVGGTVVLHDRFEPAEIWATIARERCSVVLGVPTIWQLLLEHPSFADADLSSIRWLISGGAPLPRWLIEAYEARGIAFKQGYGLTEVGVNCFAMTVDEARTHKGSIGKPLMFTEARLVAADGTEVSAGEVGELLLRGPHVCRGYWRQPQATAAALDADGWFHTGDLARRDGEGFFTIAGRIKEMFISGGVNVFPAEIESELVRHPRVQEAAVIGMPDPTWGEVGVAFVVARPGGAPTAAELADFLADRLARYKLPRRFVFVAELPRTASGKVVRASLREAWQRRASEGSP